MIRHYLIAFVLGVALTSAYTADRIGDLRVQAECAYHEGYQDAWRESEPSLLVRDLPDGAQEITVNRGHTAVAPGQHDAPQHEYPELVNTRL